MFTCNLKPTIRPTISSTIKLGGCAEIPSGAPVNTQQASFAPSPPSEGDTVEANEGQWSSDTPITYAYQWQLDGADIPGATLKTLLILPEMARLALRCVVTAVNATGSTISTTTSAVVTTINYVASLNGNGQFWQLSAPILIPLTGLVEVEVELYPTIVDTEWTAFISGGDNALNLTKNGTNAGNLRTALSGGGNVWGPYWVKDESNVVGMKSTSSNSFNLSRNGTVSGDSFSFPAGAFFDKLGKRDSSPATLSGYIKRLSITVDGVLVNEINLTNKAQGATQLATVGSVNATMIGYDESVWEIA